MDYRDVDGGLKGGIVEEAVDQWERLVGCDGDCHMGIDVY